MPKSLIRVVWLAALIGAGCATSPPATTPGGEAPPWLQSLTAAVGDRRLLQLGESGHGMAETYRLKTEIVRHLHERHGFDVLAVEGGIAECWVAAQRMAEWTAEQSMRACFWGAWASEEAEALFEYLRSATAAGRPMRLVGFDNSPTSRAFSSWIEATPGLPPTLAAAERSFLRIFAGDFEGEEGLAEIRRRAAAGFQAAREATTEPMLAMIIEDRLATLDFNPAEFDRAAFERLREQRMAVNLLRHIQREPDARIIVWAHNAHIAHAYSRFVGGVPRQGEFVQGALGDAGYTLGIYPLGGRGYAWFINQDYDLRPPEADSLEARLAAMPGDPVFLDLRGTAAERHPWIRQPVKSFEWGLNEQLIVPAEMYDGLLLIREVTPITRSGD
ncbi:MAG TPA: erythromycin esterase family protein [Gammaproteobacteria bacterium]|nr:erythromycin esterase family protein [Gammaproteobacteria bacterium]